MPTIQKDVHSLEEGDIIEGVGYVVSITQFASGVSVDVRLDALDALATVGFAPRWTGLNRNEDGTYNGTGWSWPTVPVSGKVT